MKDVPQTRPAERTNSRTGKAVQRAQLQNDGVVDNRASTLAQSRLAASLHSSPRLVAQRAMAERINQGTAAAAFRVPTDEAVAQHAQETQPSGASQQAEQYGKLTDNQHTGRQNAEPVTAKAPAVTKGAPPKGTDTDRAPEQKTRSVVPGLQQSLIASLSKHEAALRQAIYPPGHPGLQGRLPTIAPPPEKKMSAQLASTAAPAANAGTQAPIQRVQAARDGTFNSGAAKIATGAGLPAMGGVANGGVRVNNTGISGTRNGINNASYGSGVGNWRPTDWTTFCNLTGYTGNNWFQLHLMNDNLGGRGIGDNLAPGSPSFNAQHRAGAETAVKNWAGHDNHNTAASQAVDYSVNAVYGNPAAVRNDVITKYTNKFDLQTQIDDGVNNTLLTTRDEYIKLQQQHYLNFTYPDLWKQYIDDLQTYMAIVQHNQNAPFWQPRFLLPALPVAPIVPTAFMPFLGVAETQLIYQTTVNYVTQLLNTQMATDDTWLQNYVASTFPSSFACTAVFYDENATGAVVASAQQTVNISY